tara:strand:- start:829 stop:2115 length:1287 start_codon:yes stop_codon:yes gene_type:complete
MKNNFFSWYEWLIAWRYLLAKRKEGGISVIAWYSLIGVTLAVGTLIVIQSVMIGFREEFTNRIIGANPHISIYMSDTSLSTKIRIRKNNYKKVISKLNNLESIISVAPVLKASVMATASKKSVGLQLNGMKLEDLKKIPLIINEENSIGNIDDYQDGVAIGIGVAKALNLNLNDRIRLISPDGSKTIFGTTPLVGDFRIKYIFNVGRFDIDSTRIYMPLKKMQNFFDINDEIDQIDLMLNNPLEVDDYISPLRKSLSLESENYFYWTWKDSSGAFINALNVERRVMLIIFSLVVLIAALNIISGLVMLVKNKTKDIAILRTIGFSEGMIMRVFFLCGSLIGIIGTFLGVVWGCLFSFYIGDIQLFIENLSGGTIWNPEIRFLSQVPSKLRLIDILTAISISLFISFVITIIPARNAAKTHPVEAMRNE